MSDPAAAAEAAVAAGVEEVRRLLGSTMGAAEGVVQLSGSFCLAGYPQHALQLFPLFGTGSKNKISTVVDSSSWVEGLASAAFAEKLQHRHRAPADDIKVHGGSKGKLSSLLLPAVNKPLYCSARALLCRGVAAAAAGQADREAAAAALCPLLSGSGAAAAGRMSSAAKLHQLAAGLEQAVAGLESLPFSLRLAGEWVDGQHVLAVLSQPEMEARLPSPPRTA